MSIIGMLNFFDEPDILIKRSVRGLANLGATKIVACDGAYALYPEGQPRSSRQTIEVLERACLERRIMLHLHQPDVVWAGNEVEKRQKMLDMALGLAYSHDWLVIWDCDYRLVTAPPRGEISDALTSTSCDVVTIGFTENPLAKKRDYYQMAMFLRARPGLRMDGNHHTYVFRDGRRTQVLRRPVENEARGIHMPLIQVLHDVHQRDPERRRLQAAYYEQRDGLGVEA